MHRYPDNRGKFAGVGQWSVAPANPRGDNLVPTNEPVTTIASRGIAPREVFRISTTEDEELLLAQAEADEIKKRQDEYVARQDDKSIDSVSVGASNASSLANIADRKVSSISGEYHSVPVGGASSETGTAMVGSSAASILGTDD